MYLYMYITRNLKYTYIYYIYCTYIFSDVGWTTSDFTHLLLLTINLNQVAVHVVELTISINHN